MKDNLSLYLFKQLTTFFPDENSVDHSLLKTSVEKTLAKLRYAFKYIDSKYYQGDFAIMFNPLNGDHYSMFLYWVSRFVFEVGKDETLSSKIFLLNKALFGVDAFYKVQLPDIFLFVHPLGTVLGSASYSDFFCVYQGCTVGSKQGEFKYPQIGSHVTLYSNSSLIGECKIGNHVILGANSSVISRDIVDKSLILGYHPNQKIRSLSESDYPSVFIR